MAPAFDLETVYSIVRMLVGRDHVVQTKFGAIDSESSRGDVDKSLEHHHADRLADAPIRTHRTLVGRDRERLISIRTDLVRTGHRHRSDVGLEGAPRIFGVGADVACYVRPQPEHAAVLGKC